MGEVVISGGKLRSLNPDSPLPGELCNTKMMFHYQHSLHHLQERVGLLSM